MTDLTASSVQRADAVPVRSRFPVHIVVFLAPALAIYTLFSIYPLIDTIRLSLYAGDETGARSFVGLANFRHASDRSELVGPVLERARATT